ncbi:GntR family transcriptional regulator [Alteribacter salitolerans]|uniref:GntR family transcriptional regulator n=1 Tax=Alteribacter salitolerans TaxID=2912333 RepID=UPI003013B002
MDKLKRPQSLTEQAYREIKRSIINNEVEPLAYLAEEKIANNLGISRTPIREALKQLAFEGLVELRKGSKARVSSVSPEDALDYQLLRERLESLSAELAANYTTERDIRELIEITKQQNKSLELKDYHQFIELDYQFHSKIAELSNNKKLVEFINYLNLQVQRFLVLSNTLSDSGIEAVDEHYVIIEMLQKQESEQAGVTMQNHIKNVTRRIFGHSKTKEDTK